MKAFKAIIKLTFQNAMRSHIFQLLLGLLGICVIAIPITASGDGSAAGFIQVSLLYSLAGVGIILALSSIWVSCYIMTQDIEGYQIHMVLSKPVSRFSIWLAKFTGVVLLHAILLFISAVVIYVIIIGQFARNDFQKGDKERVQNEVLVGRRVFKFTPPNLDERSREMLAERLQKVAITGEHISITQENEKSILQEMRKMAIAEDAKVAFEQVRQWKFDNLPSDNSQPLFLRYRTYVGKVSTKDQRMTMGQWYIGAPVYERDADGKIVDGKRYQFQFYAYPVENIRSGEFYEKVIPTKDFKVVASDGKAMIAYLNLDPEKQTQYFQPSDGPQILMKVTGFFANYLRAVAVIMLEIIILVGLGCAIAGCTSMPTAIFISIAYLFCGSFASYLAENALTGDGMVKVFSKILLVLIIPLQKFSVSEMVSKGELIEFSFMGGLFLNYFILKALPIMLIFMYFYKKREIGLVVRR